jgi:hypothetical protein
MGKNFANGAVTEPIAMRLALCPGKLEYNRPRRTGHQPVLNRWTKTAAEKTHDKFVIKNHLEKD